MEITDRLSGNNTYRGLTTDKINKQISRKLYYNISNYISKHRDNLS